MSQCGPPSSILKSVHVNHSQGGVTMSSGGVRVSFSPGISPKRSLNVRSGQVLDLTDEVAFNNFLENWHQNTVCIYARNVICFF